MTLFIDQLKVKRLSKVVGCLLMGGAMAFGQTVTTTSSSSSTAPVSSNLLQVYQQEQTALLQQEAALEAQGATPAQMAAWYQQNAAQFQAQFQRAQALGAASEIPSPVPVQPNIPANASPTLSAFLTTQAALANARLQLHNQIMQSLPSNATEDQVDQAMYQEEQLFQQQHVADLQLQAQRGAILAQESSQQATPLPPPLQLPPNASPQLAAFLTLRNQLAQEEAQVSNQYATADLQTKEAAIQQWHQANAAQFQQLQQLGQNLATSTTN